MPPAVWLQVPLDFCQLVSICLLFAFFHVLSHTLFSFYFIHLVILAGTQVSVGCSAMNFPTMALRVFQGSYGRVPDALYSD